MYSYFPLEESSNFNSSQLLTTPLSFSPYIWYIYFFFSVFSLSLYLSLLSQLFVFVDSSLTEWQRHVSRPSASRRVWSRAADTLCRAGRACFGSLRLVFDGCVLQRLVLSLLAIFEHLWISLNARPQIRVRISLAEIWASFCFEYVLQRLALSWTCLVFCSVTGQSLQSVRWNIQS